MSAKIFSERNLKFVELLFKMLSSLGNKCYKIGSWASIKAFLIELKHSTIWRRACKKSSEPSNLAFSHPSSNLLVVSIKSRDIIHPLKIWEFIKSEIIPIWVKSPLSFVNSVLLTSLSPTSSILGSYFLPYSRAI